MNRVEQDKMFFNEAKNQISKIKSENKKMHEVLKAMVDAQYEKGGTLAGLNGAVSNARDLLKKLES